MSAKLNEELVYQGKSVSAWVQLLEHPDDAERRRAAEALVQISTALTAVLPSLTGVLKKGSPVNRAQATAALGEFGAQVATLLPMLRATLRATVVTDGDETVRSSALQALVQLGPQTGTQVPALVDTLRDDLAYVRLSAAHALGQLGAEAKEAVPALTTCCLRDPDPHVRLEAAVALWRIDRRGARVLPALVQALREEDEVLRWIAADCLGEMGPEAQSAVPALLEALQSPFKARLIRMSLTLALERIDPSAAAKAGVH
jgi:HEAT repeat protein